MAAPSENVPHVQIKFFTKMNRFSVADNAFSVPGHVGVKDLNSLLNTLINVDIDRDIGDTSIVFDFLIGGEFLRHSLAEHLQQKDISIEDVTEIEFILHHSAPQPENSLAHNDWVSCLQGNKKFIVSGCYDNTIKIWTLDGVCVLTIPGHSAPLKDITWLPSNNEKLIFVSASHDQTVLIWHWSVDDNSIDCVSCCRGHASSVECIDVDFTNTRLGTGSWDGMVKIWSTDTDRTAFDGENDGDPPKKKQKNDHKVSTKVPLLTLGGHKESVAAIQWTADNQLWTASWDHTLKLWDIETATQVNTINGNKAFLGVSYSKLNNTLVTASVDRHVRLYDPRVTDGSLVQGTYTSHTGWVSSVVWSKTDPNLFISGSYDQTVKLWDTRSPKAPLFNMSGHDDKILAVDWSIPDLILSGGADNNLKIFKYESQR